MAELSGYTATITGLSMSMPSACCRCGAPPTKTLSTQAQVRGFNLGGQKTRSIDLPYCDACEKRARAIQWARNKLFLVCTLVALVAAGFGVLVPFLPKLVLIVVPTALAVLICVVLRQQAGTNVEDRHGAWMSHASKDRSTFFCVNQKWAEDFASANGTQAVPAKFNDAVRPWLIALFVTGGASTFVSFAVRPSVHIDNASKQAVQVWVDGKPSVVAQPVSGLGERPTINLPMGQHTFGWSPVGASAPVETTAARKVAWLGDHLYNPGKTTCYDLDLTIYGSASGKGKQQGIQPIDDFYTFDHVDNWFKENPHTVSTKGSGATRMALLPVEVCASLAEQGCALPIRTEMVECLRKTQGTIVQLGVKACIEKAVQRCAKELKH
jgi:hypothetical protein